MRTLYFCPAVNSSFFFFFLFTPLISVVAEWMSTILLSTHGVALVPIQNAVLKCAAHTSLEIQDAKMTQKIAIYGPSHNFIRLNLRNEGMYQQPEKLVKQQYLLHISSQYGELRLTSG